MPAKRPTKASVSTSKPNGANVQFVNYSLTTEQTKELKATKFGLDECENLLAQLTDSDYKVTLTFDDYNSAFACFIVPKSKDNPNFGYILSGRGSTPIKALKQAGYIHYQLFEGHWLEYAQQVRYEPIDD